MLRSSYCSLSDHTDKELTDLGECPYDQVCRSLSLSYAYSFVQLSCWMKRMRVPLPGWNGHAACLEVCELRWPQCRLPDRFHVCMADVPVTWHS